MNIDLVRLMPIRRAEQKCFICYDMDCHSSNHKKGCEQEMAKSSKPNTLPYQSIWIYAAEVASLPQPSLLTT